MSSDQELVAVSCWQAIASRKPNDEIAICVGHTVRHAGDGGDSALDVGEPRLCGRLRVALLF
jgi:hypothetical protein